MPIELTRPVPAGMVLEVDPLRALADVEPGERLARGARGPLRMVQSVDLATETGWPVRVIHVLVLAPDGAILENRLGAFYQFLVWGGVIVARSTELARWEAGRPELLELLRTVRPRLRAERPAVLADLLS